MFTPMVTIPVKNVVVAVDYDFGDVRIMFKDTDTIDSVVDQLGRIRDIVKEMEESSE